MSFTLCWRKFYKKLSNEGPEIYIDSCCDRYTSLENSK